MLACGHGDSAVTQELLKAGASTDLTNEVMQLCSHSDRISGRDSCAL